MMKRKNSKDKDASELQKLYKPNRALPTSRPTGITQQTEKGEVDVNMTALTRDVINLLATKLDEKASKIKTLKFICVAKNVPWVQYHYQAVQDERGRHIRIFDSEDHKLAVQIASANVQYHKVRSNFYPALRTVLVANCITDLSLGMRLSESGYEMLCEGLAACTTLKRLSFAGSHMGDRRFVWLKPGLLQNLSLEELDLTSCGLTDIAAMSVAASIKVAADRRTQTSFARKLREYPDTSLPNRRQARRDFRRRMKEINRQVNEQCGGLLLLDMAENKITDRGALCLIDALAFDRRMLALGLRANTLTADIESEFISLMKHHHALARVDLRQNLDPRMGILKLNRPQRQPQEFNPAFGFFATDQGDLPSPAMTTASHDTTRNLAHLKLMASSLGPTPADTPFGAPAPSVFHRLIHSSSSEPLSSPETPGASGAQPPHLPLEKLCQVLHGVTAASEAAAVASEMAAATAGGGAIFVSTGLASMGNDQTESALVGEGSRLETAAVATKKDLGNVVLMGAPNRGEKETVVDSTMSGTPQPSTANQPSGVMASPRKHIAVTGPSSAAHVSNSPRFCAEDLGIDGTPSEGVILDRESMATGSNAAAPVLQGSLPSPRGLDSVRSSGDLMRRSILKNSAGGGGQTAQLGPNAGRLANGSGGGSDAAVGGGARPGVLALGQGGGSVHGGGSVFRGGRSNSPSTPRGDASRPDKSTSCHSPHLRELMSSPSVRVTVRNGPQDALGGGAFSAADSQSIGDAEASLEDVSFVDSPARSQDGSMFLFESSKSSAHVSRDLSRNVSGRSTVTWGDAIGSGSVRGGTAYQAASLAMDSLPAVMVPALLPPPTNAAEYALRRHTTPQSGAPNPSSTFSPTAVLTSASSAATNNPSAASGRTGNVSRFGRSPLGRGSFCERVVKEHDENRSDARPPAPAPPLPTMTNTTFTMAMTPTAAPQAPYTLGGALGSESSGMGGGVEFTPTSLTSGCSHVSLVAPLTEESLVGEDGDALEALETKKLHEKTRPVATTTPPSLNPKGLDPESAASLQHCSSPVQSTIDSISPVDSTSIAGPPPLVPAEKKPADAHLPNVNNNASPLPPSMDEAPPSLLSAAAIVSEAGDCKAMTLADEKEKEAAESVENNSVAATADKTNSAAAGMTTTTETRVSSEEVAGEEEKEKEKETSLVESHGLGPDCKDLAINRANKDGGVSSFSTSIHVPEEDEDPVDSESTARFSLRTLSSSHHGSGRPLRGADAAKPQEKRHEDSAEEISEEFEELPEGYEEQKHLSSSGEAEEEKENEEKEEEEKEEGNGSDCNRHRVKSPSLLANPACAFAADGGKAPVDAALTTKLPDDKNHVNVTANERHSDCKRSDNESKSNVREDDGNVRSDKLESGGGASQGEEDLDLETQRSAKRREGIRPDDSSSAFSAGVAFSSSSGTIIPSPRKTAPRLDEGVGRPPSVPTRSNNLSSPRLNSLTRRSSSPGSTSAQLTPRKRGQDERRNADPDVEVHNNGNDNGGAGAGGGNVNISKCDNGSRDEDTVGDKTVEVSTAANDKEVVAERKRDAQEGLTTMGGEQKQESERQGSRDKEGKREEVPDVKRSGEEGVGKESGEEGRRKERKRREGRREVQTDTTDVVDRVALRCHGKSNKGELQGFADETVTKIDAFKSSSSRRRESSVSRKRSGRDGRHRYDGDRHRYDGDNYCYDDDRNGERDSDLLVDTRHHRHNNSHSKPRLHLDDTHRRGHRGSRPTEVEEKGSEDDESEKEKRRGREEDGRTQMPSDETRRRRSQHRVVHRGLGSDAPGSTIEMRARDEAWGSEERCDPSESEYRREGREKHANNATQPYGEDGRKRDALRQRSSRRECKSLVDDANGDDDSLRRRRCRSSQLSKENHDGNRSSGGDGCADEGHRRPHRRRDDPHAQSRSHSPGARHSRSHRSRSHSLCRGLESRKARHHHNTSSSSSRRVRDEDATHDGGGGGGGDRCHNRSDKMYSRSRSRNPSINRRSRSRSLNGRSSSSRSRSHSVRGQSSHSRSYSRPRSYSRSRSSSRHVSDSAAEDEADALVNSMMAMMDVLLVAAEGKMQGTRGSQRFEDAAQDDTKASRSFLGSNHHQNNSNNNKNGNINNNNKGVVATQASETRREGDNGEMVETRSRQVQRRRGGHEGDDNREKRVEGVTSGTKPAKRSESKSTRGWPEVAMTAGNRAGRTTSSGKDARNDLDSAVDPEFEVDPGPEAVSRSQRALSEARARAVAAVARTREKRKTKATIVPSSSNHAHQHYHSQAQYDGRERPDREGIPSLDRRVTAQRQGDVPRSSGEENGAVLLSLPLPLPAPAPAPAFAPGPSSRLTFNPARTSSRKQAALYNYEASGLDSAGCFVREEEGVIVDTSESGFNVGLQSGLDWRGDGPLEDRRLEDGRTTMMTLPEVLGSTVEDLKALGAKERWLYERPEIIHADVRGLLGQAEDGESLGAMQDEIEDVRALTELFLELDGVVTMIEARQVANNNNNTIIATSATINIANTISSEGVEFCDNIYDENFVHGNDAPCSTSNGRDVGHNRRRCSISSAAGGRGFEDKREEVMRQRRRTQDSSDSRSRNYGATDISNTSMNKVVRDVGVPPSPKPSRRSKAAAAC